MKLFIHVFIVFSSLLLLPGCWDQFELTEWAFVQGAAIDLTEDGKIQLMTHIYKPKGSGAGGGGAGGGSTEQGEAYINIRTDGDTVFDAIRDLTMHLGRKAQWSHMRTLIISESLAKERNIGEIMDFFSRDHEPRATIHVMIGKNKASDYLETKPLMESTAGQQLREIARTASEFTGKTEKTQMIEMSIQLKSEVSVAMLPYIFFDEKNTPKTIISSGIALIKEGKLAEIASPHDTQRLLLLTGRYKKEIIEIPCPGQKEGQPRKMDSFEVRSGVTKLTPNIKGYPVTVDVSAKIEGSIGELTCSTLMTEEETMQFIGKLEKTVKKEFEQTIQFLQKNKIDAIGIGNKIYAQDPKTWQSWKPDWDERFATIDFNVKVQAKVLNTGMNIGKPYAE